MSHDGLTDSKPRAVPVKPISFLNSLLKIWRPPVSNNGLPGPLKLGTRTGSNLPLGKTIDSLQRWRSVVGRTQWP